MKTTVKTSWIALLPSVAAASPAALPDSERASAARSRGRLGGHRRVDDGERRLGRRVPCEAAGARQRGLAQRGAALGLRDEVAHAGHELGGVVGQQAGLPVDDRLAQAADAHGRASACRRRRPRSRSGTSPRPTTRSGPPRRARAAAPSRPRRRGRGRSRGRRARARDRGLQRLAVVPVAGDVEVRRGDRLERRRAALDALVLLQPPEVEQRRLGRLRAREGTAPARPADRRRGWVARGRRGRRGPRARPARSSGPACRGRAAQRQVLEQEGGHPPRRPSSAT